MREAVFLSVPSNGGSEIFGPRDQALQWEVVMETRCVHPKLDDITSGFIQRKEQPSVIDLDQVVISISQNDTLLPWHTQLAQCACGQPAYP